MFWIKLFLEFINSPHNPHNTLASQVSTVSNTSPPIPLNQSEYRTPKKMAEEEEAPTSLPAIAHPDPSPPAPPAQQPQQPQEEQQPAPPPIAPLPLAPTTYPIDTEMGEAAVCSFCRLYILLSIWYILAS